jgi:hypothetical protein
MKYFQDNIYRAVEKLESLSGIHANFLHLTKTLNEKEKVYHLLQIYYISYTQIHVNLSCVTFYLLVNERIAILIQFNQGFVLSKSLDSLFSSKAMSGVCGNV